MRVELWVDQTGHEYLRVDGRSIAHHRVLAYCWGEIDDLDDPREIDHQVPFPWLNIESNLQALDPVDHARLTPARARERRRRDRRDGSIESYATDGGDS